jgi:hypothetical protein
MPFDFYHYAHAIMLDLWCSYAMHLCHFIHLVHLHAYLPIWPHIFIYMHVYESICLVPTYAYMLSQTHIHTSMHECIYIYAYAQMLMLQLTSWSLLFIYSLLNIMPIHAWSNMLICIHHISSKSSWCMIILTHIGSYTSTHIYIYTPICIHLYSTTFGLNFHLYTQTFIS